jgi:hypothetical protein
MKTVLFSIQTLDSPLGDFSASWKAGEGDASPRIGFET